MEIVQKAIEAGEENGYNVTELQERLDAFSEVYNEVKALADEGRWEEALSVMEENRETIEEFHKAIAFVMRKAHERELDEKLKDVRAFLEEMNGRIGLSWAFSTTSLLRAKKPVQARVHFGVALEMLQKVEKFILAHS